MKQNREIQDDEIRVIGVTAKSKRTRSHLLWIIAILGIILAGLLIIFLAYPEENEPEPEEASYFEPLPEIIHYNRIDNQRLGEEVDSLSRGYTQSIDTLINDIPLRIHIPHNAEMMLHVGKLNKQDSSIIYIAQAADIRQDNKKIVGAFVLKGEPLAWGLSKKGFCAIIDNQITIGVSDDSPLFERATEKEGYFFRQYPLVDNGVLVENQPKNKSIRRSLCDRNGEIMMIESLTKESFHDFSQALVDLGVTNAIYLIGSVSYGWSRDANNNLIEFGTEQTNPYKNINYIVWRRKQD